MAPKKQKKPAIVRVSSPVPTLRKHKIRAKRTGRDDRRWWTDDERESILAAVNSNGGDVAKTARQLGVPDSTIRCWVKGHRCPEALQLRNEKNGDLANACEEIAWQFAAVIPRKIDDAPLNQCAVSFGIMVDKMRLLRGEYTNFGRTESVSRNTNLNIERLPPDERAAFLRLLAVVAGVAEPGGGDGPVPAERPGNGEGTRHKVAGVLGAGVSPR